MALNDTDLFLVNRNTTSYKIKYSDIKTDISNSVSTGVTKIVAGTGISIAPTTGVGSVEISSDAINAFLPLAGGNMTGSVTQTERAVGASSFDLRTGNFWSCGVATVPPTANGQNGQSGLIRFTTTVTGWDSQFSGPGVTADVTSGAIVPFYVLGGQSIFVGNPVGGS
jgi:hypothetical protein